MTYLWMGVLLGVPLPLPKTPYIEVDIGPPLPYLGTAERHRKNFAEGELVGAVILFTRKWNRPSQLPADAPSQDQELRQWLLEGLHVRPARKGEERMLRVTFHKGTRAEQILILNQLLKLYEAQQKRANQKQIQAGLEPEKTHYQGKVLRWAR